MNGVQRGERHRVAGSQAHRSTDRRGSACAQVDEAHAGRARGVERNRPALPRARYQITRTLFAALNVAGGQNAAAALR